MTKDDRAVVAAAEAIADFQHVSQYRANPRQLARVAVRAAKPLIEADLMARANLVQVDLRKVRELLAQGRRMAVPAGESRRPAEGFDSPAVHKDDGGH